MSLLYAIGDVHGRRDHLEVLLKAIRTDAADRGGEPRIVFLGDIIDRGLESRQAIDLVIETIERHPGSRLILGNHEEFMLRFVDAPGDRSRIASHWYRNGGLETLSSYGFNHRAPADEIAASFANDFSAHMALLREADWMVQTERHCMVHGGIDPMLPLADQDPVTTRWIRGEFLEWRGPLEKIVVHGHTPTESRLPEVRSNRIAIDTGVFFSGHLTAAALDETAPPRFLSTDGHGRSIGVAEVRPQILDRAS